MLWENRKKGSMDAFNGYMSYAAHGRGRKEEELVHG
jgi:hypothetical protein